MLDPEGAALLAQLALDALARENIDAIGGLEMGAVPISGAVAALGWITGKPIPNFFVRKKPKEHGHERVVEPDNGVGLLEVLVQRVRVVAVDHPAVALHDLVHDRARLLARSLGPIGQMVDRVHLDVLDAEPLGERPRERRLPAAGRPTDHDPFEAHACGGRG